MNALKMITSSKFFAINKELLHEFGIEAALLLADLALAQESFSGQFFYKTQQQIEQDTALSAKMQKKAVELLKRKGVLETKLIGMPAKLHYFLNCEALSQYLPNGQTSIAENAKQVSPKVLNKISQNGDTLNKKENNKNLNNNNLYVKAGLSIFVEEKFWEFVKYRNEIKKPFKTQKSLDTKVEQLIEQCRKYGEQAVIESIETAIANGWQGTFIDKQYLETKNQKTYENRKQQTISFIERATDFELE